MLVSKYRPVRVMAVAAAVALGASACGGGEIGAQTSENASAAASNAASDCAEINMAVNPWVGYEASAYVVGTVASE